MLHEICESLSRILGMACVYQRDKTCLLRVQVHMHRKKLRNHPLALLFLRRLTSCTSPVPQSAAERRQVEARVGRHLATDLLCSLEKTVILIVGANPKPDNRIHLEQSERSISQANTNRIDWLAFFHPLEEKTGMRRIISPQLVGFPCALADFWGQSPIMFPERFGRL